MKPIKIILHHSASPQTQTAAAIDAYHKKLWNFKSSLGHYAGYQYIIEANGNVFQARRDDEAGAHTAQQNMNNQSIGICIIGWYDKGHDNLPTSQQQASLKKLLNDKLKQWGLKASDIMFHRDYASKSCPGYNITKDWIYSLIDNNNHMNCIQKREDTWQDNKSGDIYIISNPKAAFAKLTSTTEPNQFIRRLYAYSVLPSHFVSTAKIAEITKGKKEVTNLNQL